VIGYDQRFNSELFAAAAAEVLAGNGINVWLTDRPTPTPVISFGVVHHGAAGAVNITASHNPPTDNGFKVRDSNGGAVDPAGLKDIEASIPPLSEVKRIGISDAQTDGRVQLFDASVPYLEHIKGLLNLGPIQSAGIRIVVDPMWGNGVGWLPRILQGGNNSIEEIHNVRNPSFPEMLRPEPIPPNVDVGLKSTLEQNADVLVIYDGDADRVGAGTEKGDFINQLQMFALLAYYLLEVRGMRGAIVKTLSTTTMLNKLAKIYDVPIYETGVGFKYVAPKMIETDALIGGEESGGFAFRGNVPERDGLVASLYFLDLMVQLRMKPSQLIEHLYEKVGAHFYKRIDTRLGSLDETKRIRTTVDSASPSSIAGLAVKEVNKTDGYKYVMEDGGWLLVRFSGTEPLVRVYCETTHESKVDDILNDGLALAGISRKS
jgi:phosphomannomutase